MYRLLILKKYWLYAFMAYAVCLSAEFEMAGEGFSTPVIGMLCCGLIAVLAWLSVYVFRAWLLLVVGWGLLAATSDANVLMVAGIVGTILSCFALLATAHLYVASFGEAINMRVPKQRAFLRSCTYVHPHPKKKIVIVTASDGFGHLTAGQVWFNRMRAAHPDATIVCLDIFEYMDRWGVSLFRSIEFCAMYIPELHAFAHWIAMRDLRAIVPALLSPVSARLAQVIDEDVAHIVTCHPIAAASVNILRRHIATRARVTVASTDYFINPHAFYAGNEEYRLPADLLDSAPHTGTKERQTVLQSLGLSPERPAILVAVGGSGMLPPEKTLKLFGMLRAAAREGYQFALACGTNEVIVAEATLFFRDEPNVRVLSEKKSLRDLLFCFDGLLGKCGGITSAEALRANRPFAIWYAWRGQERYNLRHLRARGATYVRNFKRPLFAWLTTVSRTRQA